MNLNLGDMVCGQNADPFLQATDSLTVVPSCSSRSRDYRQTSIDHSRQKMPHVVWECLNYHETTAAIAPK